MADDPFDDDLPPMSQCPYHCRHGWVEVYQDEDGKYLGYERWGPTTGAVPVESVRIDPDTHEPMLGDDGSPLVEHKTIDLVHSFSTYPCPTHEADLFLRWQEGTLGSDRPQRRGSRT